MAKYLTLYDGHQTMKIYGGPYRSRPRHLPGVKMAAEIEAPCDVSIPTVDFSIPSEADMYNGLLKSLKLLMTHHEIYVGCMGGVGRTGFFMAIMARIMEPRLDRGLEGEHEAILYVRKHYQAHAVETKQQMEFVREFPVWKLRLWRRFYRFWSYTTFAKAILK